MCELFQNYSDDVLVSERLQVKSKKFVKEKGKLMKKKQNGVYTYNGFTIDFRKRECQCVWFHKNATCHHLVGVAILEDTLLPG